MDCIFKSWEREKYQLVSMNKYTFRVEYHKTSSVSLDIIRPRFASVQETNASLWMTWLQDVNRLIIDCHSRYAFCHSRTTSINDLETAAIVFDRFMRANSEANVSIALNTVINGCQRHCNPVRRQFAYISLFPRWQRPFIIIQSPAHTHSQCADRTSCGGDMARQVAIVSDGGDQYQVYMEHVGETGLDMQVSVMIAAAERTVWTSCLPATALTTRPRPWSRQLSINDRSRQFPTCDNAANDTTVYLVQRPSWMSDAHRFSLL